MLSKKCGASVSFRLSGTSSKGVLSGHPGSSAGTGGSLDPPPSLTLQFAVQEEAGKEYLHVHH